jgi:hypothetical protein
MAMGIRTAAHSTTNRAEGDHNTTPQHSETSGRGRLNDAVIDVGAPSYASEPTYGKAPPLS